MKTRSGAFLEAQGHELQGRPEPAAESRPQIVGADGRPSGNAATAQSPANRDAEWKVVVGPGNFHSGDKAVRCISRGDADTSYSPMCRRNTQYRLSTWVKSHALRGKISLNSHGTPVETERLTAAESGWVEVDTTFNSGDRTTASINILQVARGDGYFDDVKLCELLPDSPAAEQLLAGDAKRGEEIFLKHPTAACVLCHMLKGQGSTVGPALDGLASRATSAQILESLVEPGKTLAKGFEALGASPMPPMGLILKPQELEDIQAFLQTLK